MHKYQCRLCGFLSLKTALSLKNAPRNVQRLFREKDLDQDTAVNLNVLSCERCGFVQVDPLLEDSYYDDYMMLATHSQQVQDYQCRQSHDFVNKYNLMGKSVKEVGCGDGSYLNHLKAAGCLPSGIEPSKRSREIAIERGHSVEDGYVTASRQLQESPFDAFVTRQVLEHVPDIHGFLTGIHANLKSGGVGLVEVPSLEKALADRRYYDFFPDHVNYFSFRTLRLALEINGFEVLEMYHDMYEEYIVAIVRRYAHPQLYEIANTVNTLGTELCSLIRDYRKNGKKVAIWGAGGKGLSVMAAAGILEIDLLVDGDPNKQGLFTPVSHLKIEAPSAILTSDISAIIITAMAYKDEIVHTLINELNFTGEIIVLGHQLKFLDDNRG